MADIIEPNRVSAQIEGDFVVFLIGIRINKLWKIHKWLPVFKAMPTMLRELITAPAETGFLGHSRLGLTVVVQYWRSFEHLERYARSRGRLHWPAWVEFNRRMKDCRGDVGIWHETYLVRSGQYEAIYSGMPLFGLAKAGRQARVTEETESARQRLQIN
jgi:Monooxygenase af470-like